jgi:predicted lipoprotein with Yx(FWY)xxD motif
VIRSGRRALCGLLLIAATASCGESDRPARSAPPKQPALVRVLQTRLGRVLADGRGLALYLFVQDRRDRSTCFRFCARTWPPLLAGGTPRAGAGVEATKLHTIPRRGSRRPQLAYAGHPLYTLARSQPGHLDGEGYDGSWFLVSPRGRPVLPPGVKRVPRPSSY